MDTLTCIVTGAGRGIGRGVAARLSAGGHRVALAARTAAEIDRLAAELPGDALAIATDVTRPEAVEALFACVEREWGPADVLVANAGGATSAPLAKTTDEQWQQMLELNLTAPFRCVRRAVPAMVHRGYGRIVVVASVAAKYGDSYMSAYTASKHGVLGLVRSAARELARTGVTVNAVCPGYVDTPMTVHSIASISEITGRDEDEIRKTLADKQPTGRMATPDEVADAVLFCILGSGVTGQGINVDGGAVQS